jgi:hypothetical protein
MDKAQLIEKKYRNLAKVWGNTLLFSTNDAISLVETCHSEDVKLLGIDVFKVLDGGKIQPNANQSIDFSIDHRLSAEQAYRNAIELIQSLDESDYLFEIVF